MLQSVFKSLLSPAKSTEYVTGTFKKEFLPYIQYIRGLAIVLIVAVHCRTAFSWGDHLLQDRSWFSILAYGTILFVFISGFLFQHLNSDRFVFLNYLKQKARYVILPYIIVSIPAIVDKLFFDTGNLWEPTNFPESSILYKILYMLVTGKHFGPFWFIPMISLVYLISPLLIYLDQKKYFYILIFPVIFFGGQFLHDFGHNSNTLISFLYFLPIYILGMWASRYKKSIVNVHAVFICGMFIIYLVITILEISDFIAIGKTYGTAPDLRENSYLFNFGKFKMSLLCIVLMWLFYYFKFLHVKILSYLGLFSFGIFYLHLYIIRILEKSAKILMPEFTLNSLTFILFLIIVILLAISVVRLTKFFFGAKSRLIVGS